MKKLSALLAVSLLCTVLAQAAPIRFKNMQSNLQGPQLTASETPVGDLRVYLREGFYYEDDWEGGYMQGTQAGAVQIVFADDQSVWIQNLLSGRNDGNWIQGTIDASGDTITILPQVIGQTGVYVEDEDGNWNPIQGNLKLAMLSASAGTFVEDAATPIQFLINGDQISMLNSSASEIMGLVYCDFEEERLNGTWNLQGDYQTVFTILDEEPITLPDGANVQKYTLSSLSMYVPDTTITFVDMAFVGTDVYLGNFSSSLPGAWAKGTIVGNTVEFPSGQFLGINSGYVARLLGATFEMVEDEWGGQSPEYTRLPSFVFQYDANTGVLTSDANQALLVNLREDMIMAFNTFVKPELKPFVELPATPADPEIVDVADFYDLEGDWCFFVNIPKLDVEGNAINEEKLFYVIYIDDQLYTFDAARYELTEDLTEIPVTMSGNQFINVVTYFGASTYIQENNFHKLGVQSIYRGGGEERRSNIISYDVPTAINEINSQAEDGITYNILGMPVDDNYRGIVIRNGKKYLR